MYNPCTTHLPFTFKLSTSPSSLSKTSLKFLGVQNRLGWVRPSKLGPFSGSKAKCWYKFGKNGVNAEGTAIYGSQSRDDFDRDDVEQVLLLTLNFNFVYVNVVMFDHVIICVKNL